MNKFIFKYRNYLHMQKYGFYRLCWIPINNSGNGIYSVIELFDYELPLIDKNIIEIIAY